MATDLSNKLNHDLDSYGFSRSFTDYRRKVTTCFAYEVGDDKVEQRNDVRNIFVGSKRDALSSVSDDQTDYDNLMVSTPLVFCDERNIDLANQYISGMPNSVDPLLIFESGPNAGYKKIKVFLYEKAVQPWMFTKKMDTIYMPNTLTKELMMSMAGDTHRNLEVETHGPAVNAVTTVYSGKKTVEWDFVMAYKCPFLPSDYDEWCERKRTYNWPPPWIIEATKKDGCLVVSVGHNASDTTGWRLSVTKTEHYLTKSFNDTQMKCYTLLKLVLKWIIQPQLKDPLSSYHMKTVMFWMSEERESCFWRPDNLIDCFISSLLKLKTFVENKFCPNYFLTALNLLEGKLEGVMHMEVLRILDSIIEEGPAVVYRCLPLDAHLNGSECNHYHNESCLCLQKHNLNQRIEEIDFIDFAVINRSSTSETLNLNANSNPNRIKDSFQSCCSRLVDWYVVNEYLNRSISHSHAFSTLSVYEEMGLPNKRLYSLQKKYIAVLRGNGHVARMKLATFLHYRRRLEYCIPLLSLAIKAMESSPAFEMCKEEGASANHTEQIEGIECVYLTQLIKEFRVSEIVFGPCDTHLIPPDLKNEMRRPKTVNGTHYEGWVFVDSIVYAYYLMIVTLHDMRRYSGIISLFRRFHNVYTQKPGAIRIFRKEMAKRLFEHAFMLVWKTTNGFTDFSGSM
ncbi:uncharacterized protein LOC132552400 [Ylistrum balloti]|uniref:uncharacterized protein LOC132552400 n=1 Tax=Ylistrum balloti TaxID=509963 RepID=UPI002905F254|nr:uncharacterized protein LOC132552400 [Ylistrum balloti]